VVASILLLEETLALLASMLRSSNHHAPEGILGACHIFIQRHACNINDLGHDLVYLLNDNRFTSCPSVARSMLESCFRIGAAQRYPKLSLYIMLDDLVRAKKMRPSLEKEIRDLKSEFSIRKCKNIGKIWVLAKKANLKLRYDIDYALLCGNVHASVANLYEQERAPDFFVKLCLGSAIFSALFACSAISTQISNPDYTSRLSSLLTRFAVMSENGGQDETKSELCG
jgi:hypothetical protein